MQRYILGRIAQAIVLLVVVSAPVFVMAWLSGDPLETLTPPEATKEDLALMRAYFGLDRPRTEQYWLFLIQAVQGDFGRSIRFNRPALASMNAPAWEVSGKVGTWPILSYASIGTNHEYLNPAGRE